jgi:hypothetical protein
MSKKKLDYLDVSITMNRDDGASVTVSTKCDLWADVKRFISDFDANIHSMRNGKAQH